MKNKEVTKAVTETEETKVKEETASYEADCKMAEKCKYFDGSKNNKECTKDDSHCYLLSSLDCSEFEEEAADPNEAVEAETSEETSEQEGECAGLSANAPAPAEEKDSDDEFMEDLTEEPLSPEKAKKRIESLNVMIENCQKTVDSLHDLAEANKSGALSILKEKVKDNLTSSLNDEDIKELKEGVKQLESVKVTLNLISTLCGQYAGAKSDIDRYKKQIADIEARCRQLQLPFGENSETEKEPQEEEKEPETV